MDLVQLTFRQVPQRDRAKAVEMDRMNDWLAGGSRRRDRLRPGGDNAITVPQLNLKRQRSARIVEVLNVTIDIESRVRREHILGFCKDILDKRGGDGTKRNFAIDPAECQIVDLVSERRNVGALGRIHCNRQDVIPTPIEMRGQLE